MRLFTDGQYRKPWNLFRRPSNYVDKLLVTCGRDEEVVDAQIVYELRRARFLHRSWLARLLWAALCRSGRTRYNKHVKPRMDKIIAKLKREADAEAAQQRVDNEPPAA